MRCLYSLVEMPWSMFQHGCGWLCCQSWSEQKCRIYMRFLYSLAEMPWSMFQDGCGQFCCQSWSGQKWWRCPEQLMCWKLWTEQRRTLLYRGIDPWQQVIFELRQLCLSRWEALTAEGELVPILCAREACCFELQEKATQYIVIHRQPKCKDSNHTPVELLLERKLCTPMF